MFFKSASIALSLLLALQVQGHALIKPDISGGTARNDAKRPSANSPCGNGVNPAQLIDSATAVPVTNGQVDVTITNFNGGVDGSRQVTAQIDPTGTGKNFQAATVATNGDRAPADTGSQPIVVNVPASLKASGGASGNKMLIAFTTAGKFGNCVVASSGAAGGGTGGAGNTGTGNTQTGKGNGNGKGAGAGAGGAAGTGNGAGNANGQGQGTGRNGGGQGRGRGRAGRQGRQQRQRQAQN